MQIVNALRGVVLVWRKSISQAHAGFCKHSPVSVTLYLVLCMTYFCETVLQKINTRMWSILEQVPSVHTSNIQIPHIELPS